MKLTNAKKTLKKLLLFVFIASVSYAHADQTSQTSHEFSDIPAEFAEQLAQLDPETRASLLAEIEKLQLNAAEEHLKQILRFYDSLDVILEHMAQVINNSASQKQLGKINYEGAVQKIIEMRTILDQIKKSATATINPMNLKITITILHAILADILKLIETNFKDIKPLDLDAIVTRSLQKNISDDDLAQSLNNIQKMLDKIKDKSRYLGLSKINMFFRKAHTSLSRNHVFSRLQMLGVTFLGAYYIMSRIDQDTIDKTPFLKSIPGLSTLKNFFGDAPQYGIDGSLTNRMDVNILGSWEHSLGLKKLGILDLTVPPLVTWKVLIEPVKTNFLEMNMWVTKRWSNILNWLRGAPLDRKGDYGTKIPRARFKDLIGKDDHKAILQNLISFLDDPEFYLRAGIDINLAYLFCGPSRTGKTFLAEAFAGEAHDKLTVNGKPFNFIYFNAADVQTFGFEMVFKFAQEKGPSVLFVDEIDMTDAQRDKNSKVLAEMLTCLSGYHTNNDRNPDQIVIVIAATNRPEALESALLKPGRFGKIMWFDMPTLQERLDYLHRELRKRAIMSISPEFLEHMAKETEGCTFADLQSVIIVALQMAKAENTVLQERHIEEAFDRELRKIVKDEQALSWLSDEQVSIMAAHQAGQALVNLLLQDLPHISKVTLYPITREIREELNFARYNNEGKVKDDKREAIYSYGKLFRQMGNHMRTASVQTDHLLLDECKVLLAGAVAEKILLGQRSSYHDYERAQALEIAQKIVFAGINSEKISKKEREKALEQASELLVDLEKQVEVMLQESKLMLKTLADELKEKKTLSSVEVLEIIKKFNPAHVDQPTP